MPWDVWLIFLFLAVIVPWRGRARMQKLLAMEHVGTTERVIVYASTIAFQWTIAAAVAWRAWAHGFTLDELGLAIGDPVRTAVLALAGAALIGAFQWMNLRRVGRLPVKVRGRLQAVAERLLPRNLVERLPFFALAATAGLCEEFLYRGFAMTALRHSGMVAWEIVAVSSVLFGLAHLYQGRGGLVGTFLIGILFGWARIAYNSLIPVILWHGTLDAVAGVAGPRYLQPKVVETTNSVGVGIAKEN
jgi:membrane protease YdiL (CAAX protease family)